MREIDKIIRGFKNLTRILSGKKIIIYERSYMSIENWSYVAKYNLIKAIYPLNKRR